MMGYPMGTGSGMLLWNLLFWLLIVVAIVLLVAWVSRRKTGGDGKGEESALDILNKRYARGEISKEEYDRMKQDIS